MYTVDFNNAELMNLPGRDVRVYIGTDKSITKVKSNHMTVGLTIVPPHSTMAPHTHENEEESIFVVEGNGEVVIGGVCESIGPLVAAKFPQGIEHQVRNTGDLELKFVFIFNPIYTFGK